MIHLNRTPILLAALASVLLQSGCGGGGGGGVSAPTTSPTPTVATFTVGGTVSGMFGSGLVLQNNAGDDVTVNADGSFAFATKLAASAAYAVSVKTQPTLPAQICTLGAGSGAIAASNVTSVTVSCVLALTAPKFVYAANRGDSSLQSFSINPATGGLTFVPLTLAESALAAGTQPQALAIDPTNRFMYATALGTNSVLAFTLNPTTGKHTAVAGGTYATGGVLPTGVVTDPTGKYVYVLNRERIAGDPLGSVSAFAINATTGALTAVAGSPFTVGNAPSDITVDPKGKFVYVTNFGATGINGTVSAFNINAATGVLTPVANSPFAFGASPLTLAVDPTGRILAVTSTNGALQSYVINPVSGALTIQAINGPGYANGSSMAFDAAGRFAFIASSVTKNVMTLAFNAALLPTTTSTPIVAGDNPLKVLADPSGKFVYVANRTNGTVGGGSIEVFSIDPTTGNLTPLAGFSRGLGPDAQSIAMTR